MPTLSLDELNGGNSLGALIWQSGRIVRQWEAVVSPMDGEVYRRKTATGSGTVDPSADTTNYRAASYNRVTMQSNAWATGTVTNPVIGSTGAIRTTMPAFNAGERKLCLSLTGRGAVRFISPEWTQSSAPTSTLRTELIIDGRAVFDANQSVSNAASVYWCPVGIRANDLAVPDRIEFRVAAQLYITSNVAQANGRIILNSMYEGYES